VTASVESHAVTGTWVVLGVFGPDGPAFCSGLPLVRYSPLESAALLGLPVPRWAGRQARVQAAGEDHLGETAVGDALSGGGGGVRPSGERPVAPAEP
jgi:hypothetical protein